MTKIVLGTAGKQNVSIDLDTVLRTRLLIQANSGGGKSWLLRRIAEQAYGKVQVIIIDPEGEFASLREQYDYVLVSKGGDTAADVRSAELVAHRLLELRASAVCDLFEMKPAQRHAWVQLFLDAMIDAPKKLWHPVLVIVDEAHTFCPEKGKGESEASDAMISLVSKGRKRGFCAIFATQRLGKLRKDASAELLNRLIGPTFEDVDCKRAVDLLSIPPDEAREFTKLLMVQEPGDFWALGRAITKERLLVRVGQVKTTHPEAGSSGKVYEAPPPSEKIKALLPKLSDLPKEAEAKAKTEAELRAEIVGLRRQLQSRPTVSVPEKVVERIEIPIVSDAALKTLEALANSTSTLLAEARVIRAESVKRSQFFPSNPPSEREVIKPVIFARPGPRVWQPKDLRRSTPDGFSPDEAALSGPEQRILDAIAWFESIGQDTPDQVGVAFLAGYSYGGGAFNNPRGSLRSKGLVEYVGDDIRLTEDGRAAAKQPNAPLTIDEMHAHVKSILPGPETKILDELLQAYPNMMQKELLAEASGYKPGGAFNNPLGRLRTLGLVRYPQPGFAVASPILFLEQG